METFNDESENSTLSEFLLRLLNLIFTLLITLLLLMAWQYWKPTTSEVLEAKPTVDVKELIAQAEEQAEKRIIAAKKEGELTGIIKCLEAKIQELQNKDCPTCKK